jgi:aryl-alcohol dehydrogenase-like predicted oxidoreductase
MQTRRVGSLEVSVVGLGCNNFGWRIDAEQSAKVIDAAIESGITFFDTADRYGKGQSEDFLGRALGSRRDQIILATKFGMEMEKGQQGASPQYILEAIEASLRRLRTDRIDLYQLHQPDPKTPIPDTLGALDQLVRAGKVLEIGCSNFSARQIREAADAAKGGAHFVSVQNEFSLFHRDPENDGVLAECEARGLAFLPYFPLASGLLTGKYRRGKKLPKGSRAAEAGERLIELAESRNHTVLDLASGSQTGGIGHRRREQARTDSGECESSELETDFRRPRPNRCDHDRKVNVAGRSSAAPRGKELAPLGVLRFCDLTLWSG